MSRGLRLGVLGLLLALTLPSTAAIYSYTDADGNRVFTDRPGGRAAEPVDTKPSNSMPAQPVPLAQPPVKVMKAPTPGYASVAIVQPEAEATIRNNAGELTVSVTSDPPLHPGHRYRLLMDGAAAAEPDVSPAIALENVDRGSHQLIAEVIDIKGETVQSSAPITVYMMRTSLAQRRMVNPCKKADYGVRPECPIKDKPKEKKDIPFVPFL